MIRNSLPQAIKLLFITFILLSVSACSTEKKQHISSEDTSIKRLQLLHEVAPTAENISYPYNPFGKNAKMNLNKLQNVADSLNLRLIPQPLRNNEQIDLYLANIPPDINAIYLPNDSLISTRGKDFATASLTNKLSVSSPQ